MTKRPDPIAELVAKTGRSREEVIEVCKERAAIREHEGGLSRAEADRLAVADALDLFTRPLA